MLTHWTYAWRSLVHKNLLLTKWHLWELGQFFRIVLNRGYSSTCAMKVHTRADQLLLQLLMDSFDTLLSHYRHIGNLHEEIWCRNNNFWQNGSFVNLDIFPTCIKWADSWENLLIAYFYGLCVLISFSLLTITVRGVSNKHCLLPFFHLCQIWSKTRMMVFSWRGSFHVCLSKTTKSIKAGFM